MTSIDSMADLYVTEDSQGLHVHVGNDITARNAEEVSASVSNAWESSSRPKHLIVDLRGVRRIDSAGAGALMEIRERMNRSNVAVTLSGLEPAPHRLLERTGIIDMFRTGGNAIDLPPRRATRPSVACRDWSAIIDCRDDAKAQTSPKTNVHHLRRS
jgi:anti-anti-sigma factor